MIFWVPDLNFTVDVSLLVLNVNDKAAGRFDQCIESCQCVSGMALQLGSTITFRQCHSMTERLLPVTLNINSNKASAIMSFKCGEYCTYFQCHNHDRNMHMLSFGLSAYVVIWIIQNSKMLLYLLHNMINDWLDHKGYTVPYLP